jgi:hypothetical protein
MKFTTKRWYYVADAAALLGTSTSSIYKVIKRHEIGWTSWMQEVFVDALTIDAMVATMPAERAPNVVVEPPACWAGADERSDDRGQRAAAIKTKTRPLAGRVDRVVRSASAGPTRPKVSSRRRRTGGKVTIH